MLEDVHAAGRVPEAASPPVVREPGRGALRVREALASGLALDLVTSDGGLDPHEHAPVLRGGVDLPVRGDDPHPAAFGGEVDPVLDLAGDAGEPVEVDDDDDVDAPGATVGEHPRVVRLRAASRGCRQGVCVLADVAVEASRDPHARAALPVDPEPVPELVERHAQVDRDAEPPNGHDGSLS